MQGFLPQHLSQKGDAEIRPLCWRRWNVNASIQKDRFVLLKRKKIREKNKRRDWCVWVLDRG